MKALKLRVSGINRRLIQAILFSNGVSLLLFGIRVAGAENFRFGFLFWNLWLAWVPFLLSLWLVRSLKKYRWMGWQNLLLTFAWAAFLPNSFYIVTDLIHIHLTGEINILFDVVLFLSCIFNGYIAGFLSLYTVHQELLKRIPVRKAHLAVGATLVASSFAIYLGRFLRWNTWDVIVHPLGLIFDISDRIINPAAHPQAFMTTFIFSLTLGSMYWVVYEFVGLLSQRKR